MFCPFDGERLVDGKRPDDNTDPLIGQTIDNRYAIESIIGEGGMGTVYRAKHTTLARALAVKVLRADLARDTELSARFLQEAQATAAIKHPNIVSITDFGRLADNRPYFVMELLKGRTLASFIKTSGALLPRASARIAMGIAEGLEAAHAAGVIHRDLKPENIFLIGDAGLEGKELRVVDFGAALVVGASRLTKAGVVFGTPHYMSPEQAAGKLVDHRADIYALGIILYEMVTGKVPFEGDTYMGVLTQHMFVAPRPPSQLVPELSGQLGSIEPVILRALEKDPAVRFGSMMELAQAIELALDSEGVAPSWRPSRSPQGIANQLEFPTLVEIRARVSAVDDMNRRSTIRLAVIGAVVAVATIIGVAVGMRFVPKGANAPWRKARRRRHPLWRALVPSFSMPRVRQRWNRRYRRKQPSRYHTRRSRQPREHQAQQR